MLLHAIIMLVHVYLPPAAVIATTAAGGGSGSCENERVHARLPLAGNAEFERVRAAWAGDVEREEALGSVERVEALQFEMGVAGRRCDVFSNIRVRVWIWCVCAACVRARELEIETARARALACPLARAPPARVCLYTGAL